MAENGTLSRSQRRFVGALATTRTIRAAAAKANIGERTAWRWLCDPTVRRAADGALDSVLREATHNAASLMTKALDTLVDVMDDGEASASARVSAARAVLEVGLRYHESMILAERMSVIEERLATIGLGGR